MSSNENNEQSDQYHYNNALIAHVLRSRRIYESIVNNMRVEDEMLSDAINNNSNTSRNIDNNTNINNINTNRNENFNTNSSVATTTIGSVSPSTSYTYANVNANANNSSNLSNTSSNSSFSNNITRSLFYPTLMEIIGQVFSQDSASENRGLTPEQIEECITDTIFEELPELSRLQNNTCPISLDNFLSNSEVSFINKCGHVFFREPLRIWLSRNNTCPTCRTLVLENQNPGLTSQSQSQSQSQPLTSISNPSFSLFSSNNNTNNNNNNNSNFNSRVFLLPNIGLANPIASPSANTMDNPTASDISSNALTSLVNSVFNQVMMGTNNVNANTTSTAFDFDASGNPSLLFQISSHHTPFDDLN